MTKGEKVGQDEGKNNVVEKRSDNYLDRRLFAIQKSTRTRFPLWQKLNEKLRLRFKWYYNLRIDPLYQYSDMDDQMMAIQRSTRTLFRFAQPTHEKLRLKYKWYYKWHIRPESHKIHWALLGFYTVAVIFFFVLALSSHPQIVKAATIGCTWNNNNSTGIWNDAANWSCGNVPTNANDVIFDTTSTSAITIDVVAVAASVSVNTGYSGTITVNTANSLSTTTAGTGTGDFTISDGSITGTGDVTVVGNVAGSAGVINMTDGTFTQSVAASKNFATTTGSTAWTFYNLTFSQISGTPTITTQTGGTGDITISNVLNIAASTTFAAGNRTYHLMGTGKAFTNSSTFTSGTSTFSYENVTSATIITPADNAQGFYNLQTNPASGTPTYTFQNTATSFLAGTKVKTENGEKNIEDFKTGDKVLSYDIKTNQPIASEVTGTVSGTKDNYYIINNKVKVTENHVFILPDNSQKKFEDLRVGDTLKTYTGTETIQTLEKINQEVSVYDIEVKDYHLFYATDYLVHNFGAAKTCVVNNDFTLTGAGSATVNGNIASFNLKVSGNFLINASQTLSSASGLSIGGNYTNSGTFTHNNGSITFIGTTTGHTINTGGTGVGKDFFNLNFTGSGGAWSPLTNTLTITNDLTMTAGTFDTSNGTANVTVNGNVAGTAGIINMSSTNTFEQRVGAAKSFGTTSSANDWTFYNLTFSDSAASNYTVTTSSGGTGKIIVSGTLQIGKGTDSNITTLSNLANNRILDINGDVSITTKGSLTASSNASFTVFGNWTNAGTFTHSNGTVTFDGTATGKTINTGGTGAGKDFYNLIFNGAGGAWSPLTNTLIIANDLTMTAGTFDTSNGTANVTVNGNVACGASCGTIDMTSAGTNTFTQNVATNKNFGTSVSGTTAWAFYNLTFSSSTGTPTITTSTTATGTITVAQTLTISANTTLNAGNRSWILTGAIASPFSNSGTLTPATSTFQYKNVNAGGNVNVTTTSYNNLQFTPASAESYDMTGSLTTTNAMTGDLTINPRATLNAYVGTTSYDMTMVNVTINKQGSSTNGTLYAGTNGSVGTSTFSVAGNWLANGIFTYGTSTVIFTATDIGHTITNNVGSLNFYNVTFNGSGGAWSPTVDIGVMTINNNLTMTAGTFDTSNGTANVTVNGTVAGTAGIINMTSTNTFTQRIGAAKNFGTTSGSTNWTFNNLNFENSSAGNLTITTPGTATGQIIVGGTLTIGNAGDSYSTILNNETNDRIIDAALVTITSKGVLSASSTALFTVSDNWANSGTFTANSGTVTFDRGATTQTLNSGGTGAGYLFNNLTHSGAGTLQLVTNDLDVNGTFSQTAGIFDANSKNQNYAGSFSLSSGTTYTKGGTLTFDGTTAATYTDSTATPQNIGAVTINKTDTVAPGTNNKLTLVSSMTVDTMTIDGTVGSPDILDLASGSYILTLANAGATATVLTVNGTLNPGTSTVKYTATNSAGNVNVTTTTYSSLRFTPASAESYDMTGSLTTTNAMTGDLTIDANATVNTYVGTTSYDISCVNVTINASGVLYAGVNSTSGTSTITVSGNWTRNGTFTYGQSTVDLTGTGNVTGTTTFYNLTAAAATKTTSLSATNYTITHTLSLGTGTFTGGFAVYVGTTNSDILVNAGANVGASLTLKGNGNISIPGGQYTGLNFGGTWSSGATYTLAGNISATLVNVSVADWQKSTLNTNNYNLIISGDMVIGSTSQWGPPQGTVNLGNSVFSVNNLTIYHNATNTLSASNASISIAGNWTNGDTFTAGTSTINFTKSSGTQTLNSGGTGTGKSFNNLTHSGAGTLQLITNAINIDGVFTNSAGTFDANGLNMTVADDFLGAGGTFSAGATPGTQTVTFDGTAEATVSGSTTFNNLVMNTTGIGAKTIKFTAGTTQTIASGKTWTLDGAVGNVLTLRSTSDTNAWTFNISAPFTSGDYIDVKDSYSANANKITPGANVTNSGNNDGWIFNQTPTNDSLTFTNPYSSNVAVADDTTSWQFQAKATDLDGPTDINYIEIRFANATDSTLPYDSLKYRYTRGTDTFSEVADTQDAGTITSVAGDATSAGNQWTVNFKIKINNNFLNKDTNYAAELYTIDNSAASADTDYANKYQVTALSITLDISGPLADTVAFDNLTPGTPVCYATGTVASITTNALNGYTLGVSDATAAPNSSMHQGGVYISKMTNGTIGTPVVWGANYGVGIGLYAADTNKEAIWGTGITVCDANNKYAAIPQVATTAHTVTGIVSGVNTSSWSYKINVQTTQKTGAYSGTMTFTATAVLP